MSGRSRGIYLKRSLHFTYGFGRDDKVRGTGHPSFEAELPAFAAASAE
ncbi:MAG: hypothetical protein ACETVZ_05960 [Phycisphaerae bacterium]